MNHLALVACDVPGMERFYRDYFGFQPGHGPGFLIGDRGFLLSIEPVEVPPEIPAWLHHGFHLASRSELLALHERMRERGVAMVEPVKEQGATVVFFCRDPGGYLVEVRARASP
ncbi:VOC family protein [Stigmatella aurantiaca]|uniref:Glyoxalase/bleomycin resistance protein/dioxygenase n=1 Tax=Stigmatella aurantiaca (strain DW4/3-1) TaxID=378806 RepID=Q08PX7_STIAD|nr:VOC family protein [Stigmatella aurantiaca]ADO74591.1 Glyoxalase/bleomycin resistance protein/dioxygenase [Stigmatella aurantiaca DW4/3-1]EAU62540.1 glyoxalase/bleomycin resistance protein/dioxygenase [Stigmatella aurantiaca DW4/3-1]